jgi:hypothetical protein
VFDYNAFINELKPLIEQAHEFDADDRHYSSDVFRRWRHEVEDLISRIRRLKYSVNCGLDGRNFYIEGYGSHSDREQRDCFDRSLKDTLVELEVVIDRYTKYGDPKAKPTPPVAIAGPGSLTPSLTPEPISTIAPAMQAQAPEPAEPKWPERVTLYWLFKHMPLSAWGTLGALVAGAFSAGLAAGNWPEVKGALARFVAEPASVAVAAPPANPASK